ncbi:aspartyl protease family protein 1-like [Abrus precatorius]|uniref:Aspartyl protease family protein 1-like n=1 Tax=Abrus precatorius TaxID=3816 RepID=A0A8B8KQT2_ABRPR|nr:aspartyl protease family protein 1-like [Abrus precatorius]
MAWSCGCDRGHGCVWVTSALLLLSLASQSCYGLGSFGFDIHHRFSDPVKGILGIDNVPQKGTPQYYDTMVHRDRIFRGRRLAADHHTPLTFAAGNDTHQISAFGFLHFANVSVGTPPLWFEVALDTGSDLFWLPCNCTSCVRRLKTPRGEIIKFNIYDLDKSSTSKKVSCNHSSFCKQRKCPSSGSSCRYQVDYLSNDTSSAGFLVEDVLHLVTDDDQTKDADTQITLGCGQIQTGVFLNGAAPNGLFGLGMDNMSVPSILAKQGIISNSFSMCFGPDGSGRITFGDSGSQDQGKTPFNLRPLHPTYNVTITQIIVGGNAADLEFHAIFDSGTSFTYLNDPAYTLIAEKFNSLIKADRHSSQYPGSELPFEFCYDISPNQTIEVPFLNLTMKGGDDYYVMDPILPVSSEIEGDLLCLGIQKSDSLNIIGQNFMTGYKIVFDRDNMNLGWKESDCSDDVLTNTLPINPSHSPAVSPAIAVNPVATSNPSSNPPNSSFMIKPIFTFMMVLFLLLAIF